MLATVVLGGIASGADRVRRPARLGHPRPCAAWPGTAFIVVWTVVRWVLTIIAISLLFSVFYYFGPNRDRRAGSGSAPAAWSARAIFLLASLGFSFYVAKFGNYGKTYGAFAGVVILIFWLYLTGIAVLLGGEINAEAEREAAAQAGHPRAQATAQQLNSPA